MLLRIGGPYHGYRNGEIVELDDDEGQRLVEKLGAESGRVTILGDLREAPESQVPDDDDDDDDDDDESDRLLDDEIAAEEAAAAAAAAAADSE